MKADVYGKFVLVNIVETPYEIENNKGIAVKLTLKQDRETFDVKCNKELAEAIVKDKTYYDGLMYQFVNVGFNVTTYAEKLLDRVKAIALAPIKVTK